MTCHSHWKYKCYVQLWQSTDQIVLGKEMKCSHRKEIKFMLLPVFEISVLLVIAYCNYTSISVLNKLAFTMCETDRTNLLPVQVESLYYIHYYT